MALTSASTLADAYAQFQDNLYYESDSTGAKARALVEACRYLRVCQAQSSSGTGGDSLTVGLAQIQDAEQKAVNWLAASGLTAGSTRQARPVASFENAW